MEDKGQMNEVIEQMKLMNVLLSKHDKREETKENDATFRVFGPRVFLLFLFTMVLIVLTAKDGVNKSPTSPMYNSPSQQNTEKKRHSLLHGDVADAMKS